MNNDTYRIVQQLGAIDPYVDGTEGNYCFFCHSERRYRKLDDDHAANCLWVKAKNTPTIESFTAALKAHLRGNAHVRFAAFNEYENSSAEVNFDELDKVVDDFVAKYRPAPKG